MTNYILVTLHFNEVLEVIMQTVSRYRREDISYIVACCLAGLLITSVQFVGWSVTEGQISTSFVYQLLSSVAILSFGVACYKMGRLLSGRETTKVDAVSFIPICSSCKQVRIDGGNGENLYASNWESIEDYLYKNSNIRFSHSICPDCANAYYSELDSYFVNEKSQS